MVDMLNNCYNYLKGGGLARDADIDDEGGVDCYR